MREFIFFVSGWLIGGFVSLMLCVIFGRKKLIDIQTIIIEGFNKLSLTHEGSVSLITSILNTIKDQNQHLTTVKEQLESKTKRGNRNRRTEEQKRLASEKMKNWWLQQKNQIKEAQRNAMPQPMGSNSDV